MPQHGIYTAAMARSVIVNLVNAISTYKSSGITPCRGTIPVKPTRSINRIQYASGTRAENKGHSRHFYWG